MKAAGQKEKMLSLTISAWRPSSERLSSFLIRLQISFFDSLMYHLAVGLFKPLVTKRTLLIARAVSLEFPSVSASSSSKPLNQSFWDSKKEDGINEMKIFAQSPQTFKNLGIGSPWPTQGEEIFGCNRRYTKNQKNN